MLRSTALLGVLSLGLLAPACSVTPDRSASGSASEGDATVLYILEAKGSG